MIQRSPGGIPFVDWGGSGPMLHFSHANGFPPATYSAFIKLISDRYHCLGMEARPLWGTQDPQRFRYWRELAGDLTRFLGQMKLDSIIGAGHSLGAVTSLLCAAAEPARFRALILIDPVILPLYLSPVLAVAEWLRLSRLARLPSLTRHRQTDWTDRETLFRAYRATPVFARWKEEFLRDYVSAVTEDTGGGRVRLRYPREWEARVFETVPPDTWLAMPRLRNIPVLILRGQDSSTFRRDAMQSMRWFMPHAEFVEIVGADHFVPMSQPERTAAVVREFLEGV